MAFETDEQKKRIEEEMALADEAELNAFGSNEEELQAEATDLLNKQPVPETQPMGLQELMAKYNALNEARKANTADQSNIAMLQGANQIAQGIAMGRGAKIGAGEQGIQALQQAAKSKVDAASGDLTDANTMLGMEKSIQGLEKGQVDLEHETQMADPNSDISKFMRSQAYELLKSKSPNSPLLNQLDNMSARQLEKLGFKSTLAQPKETMPWSFTDRVTRDGHPVKVNRSTGIMYNALTNEPLSPSEVTYRDVARKDAVSGQYGYMNAGQGMTVPGLGSVNVPGAPLGQQQVPQDGPAGVSGEAQATPPKRTYQDFIRQYPEQDKKITDLKEKMLTDLKDAREVGTSITTLKNKLDSGDMSGIDSGMLGGIATQAARMAGQNGVLTDKDLEKFAGAGGVKAYILRTINGLGGKMSKEDTEFFKLFEKKMSDALNRDINNRTQLFVSEAKNRVNAFYPELDENDIKQWLSVDKLVPEVQGLTSNNEETVERLVNGRIAIFNPKTKQFIKWK